MTPKDEYIRDTHIYNIVDGDTVDGFVDLGYSIWTKQRFRLLGVDTPERGELGYTEATEYTKERLLGNTFPLKSVKTDSFGRYLATIYVDETTISLELIEKGLAKEYIK